MAYLIAEFKSAGQIPRANLRTDILRSRRVVAIRSNQNHAGKYPKRPRWTRDFHPGGRGGFHRLHRLRLYQYPHICHPSYLSYRLVFVVSYLCPRCPVAFSTAPTFSPPLASVLPIPSPFAFKLSPCLHHLFVSISLRLLTGDIKNTLSTIVLLPLRVVVHMTVTYH